MSPYGVTKQCCEQLAHAYATSKGLKAIGLRYFTVYGPRQRPDMAIQRIATAVADNGRFAVYGNGDQSRDVTYVEDAVTATMPSWTRPRRGPATTSAAAARRRCAA